jgi:hypothetical protein
MDQKSGNDGALLLKLADELAEVGRCYGYSITGLDWNNPEPAMPFVASQIPKAVISNANGFLQSLKDASDMAATLPALPCVVGAEAALLLAENSGTSLVWAMGGLIDDGNESAFKYVVRWFRKSRRLAKIEVLKAEANCRAQGLRMRDGRDAYQWSRPRTRQQWCERLDISLSTLGRRINRGMLVIDRQNDKGMVRMRVDLLPADFVDD